MTDSESTQSPEPDGEARDLVIGMRDRIVETLRSIYDPEIPVNIYDIGLIYKIDVDSDGNVDIDMTLTSPSCPVAETLPPQVEERIRQTEGVNDSKVNVVWDPTWTPDMMSEDAKLELGMM